MAKRLMRKTTCILVLLLALLMGFAGQAQAVTYVYYTDPGGIAIYYASTTTNSVSVTIGDHLHVIPDFMSWLEPTFLGNYVDDEYGDYWTSILSSGYGQPSYRRWASATFMTGLAPGTAYTLKYQNSLMTSAFASGNQGTVLVPGALRTVITEQHAPANPVFMNITQSSTNVTWGTNGNGAATSYILYRGTSASGPWTQLYNGAGTFFADSGLVANSTYYYMVYSYITGGTYKSSSILPLTTSVDPAVAAAQAAKSAAEASMAASELAKTTTLETKVEVQNLRTEFQSFANADKKDPVIASFVYSVPKATITSTATVNYSLIATDNTSLQYRYKINDGAFTGWTNLTSETISVNIGSVPGIKRITVQVMDTGGNTATATATIFKI